MLHNQWNVNFVYTSNDYHDLAPASSVWRLRARSQRLVYIPEGHELVGEKDRQCDVYQKALARWQVRPGWTDEVGGMPQCFQLPGDQKDLRDYATAREANADGTRIAYVRKNEGGWGGRGVEIRYGVTDLLDVDNASDACAFTHLEDVQCLGLEAASDLAASDSAESCSDACCKDE